MGFFMEKLSDNLLAFACIQSYLKKPVLGGYKTRILNVGNDRVIFFYNEQQIIISFTGSNDVKDWIENLFFLKKKTVYGKIHTEFWNSYNQLNHKILEIFHILNFYDKDIYVCGHSRGGALATIFCIDTPYKQNIKKLTTFGCPRIGNKKFKQSFNKRVNFIVNRYVNNQDIVPRVPITFYYHVCDAIYFNEKGIITKKKPKNYLFLYRRVKGIFDHYMRDYYEYTWKNKL